MAEGAQGASAEGKSFPGFYSHAGGSPFNCEFRESAQALMIVNHAQFTCPIARHLSGNPDLPIIPEGGFIVLESDAETWRDVPRRGAKKVGETFRAYPQPSWSKGWSKG